MAVVIMIGEALAPDWPAGSDQPIRIKWDIKYLKNIPHSPTGLSPANKMVLKPEKIAAWLEETECADLLPLIVEPGIKRVTQEVAMKVEEALRRRRVLFPDNVPEWCGCVICHPRTDRDKPHNPQCDPALGFLNWLAYWMRCALVRCNMPCIRVSK